MNFPSVFSEEDFWIIPALSTRPRFLSPSSCFRLSIKARVILCLSAPIFSRTITMFFPHVSSILTIHLHNPPNWARKAREETTSFTLGRPCANDSTTFFKGCIMSKPATGDSSWRSKIQSHFTSKIEEHNTDFIRFERKFSTKAGLFYFYSKNRLSSIFPRKLIEIQYRPKSFNFMGRV